MRWCLVAAIFVLGAGCRSSSTGYSSADPSANYGPAGAYFPQNYAPPAPQVPRSVRLTLHGVTIAMGKYDGTTWDGPGRIAPGQAQRLARALSMPNPYAEVIGILSDPVNQALAKPEVLGRATLLGASGFDSPMMLKAQRDTFTPQFSGPPSWSGVPLDGSARLSVELTDNDFLFPDPMGIFQLNSQDMLSALQAQNVVYVRVDGQTNQQILFAAISVMPE